MAKIIMDRLAIQKRYGDRFAILPQAQGVDAMIRRAVSDLPAVDHPSET